jgi:S1-C subfamily serine protease
MRFRFIVAGLALVLSWSCAHASLPDFTTIVDQVSPAVVNIEATGERTRSFRQGGAGR